MARVLESKEHSKIAFNLVNLNEDQVALRPRRFCSAYELINEDKIFIFGGFYEKEDNYLALQSDITGFDLRHFDDEGKKCIITNEKGAMYSIVNEKNRQPQGTTNSYMRARS